VDERKPLPKTSIMVSLNPFITSGWPVKSAVQFTNPARQTGKIRALQ
jgi:hypothetical protein